MNKKFENNDLNIKDENLTRNINITDNNFNLKKNLDNNIKEANLDAELYYNSSNNNEYIYENENSSNSKNLNDKLFEENEDLIENEVNKNNYYKTTLNEVISELEKKNKYKNKKIIVSIAIVAVITFTSGFISNGYLEKYKHIGTTNMNLKLENKNNSIDNNEIENKDNTKEDSNEKTGNLSIEEVVKKVSPSVVTVTTLLDSRGKSGVGTGFIIDKDGTIVTNYHVINGATSIKITLNNGKEINAKIISTSKKYDLAILKITEKIDLPGIAKISSNDDINAGQEVITIGNPLGKEFSGSVTKGIISSTRRKINMDGFNREFIQIDAAINPGNSGGPLINLKGEIIGVNTAKKSGDNVEGMGFAVPIKYVREMLKDPSNYLNENNENYIDQNVEEYLDGYKGKTNGGYQNRKNREYQEKIKISEGIPCEKYTEKVLSFKLKN